MKRLDGLPWWSSSHDSAFQGRGSTFDGWSGNQGRVCGVGWPKKKRGRETRKLLRLAQAVGIGVPGLSYGTLVITLSGGLLTIPVTQSRMRGARLTTRTSACFNLTHVEGE